MILGTPRLYLLAILCVVLALWPGAGVLKFLTLLGLVVATAADAWLIPAAARLTVHRRIEPQLPLDAVTTVYVDIVSRSTVPVRARVSDSPPEAFWCSMLVSDVTLQPRQVTTLDYQVKSPRRGAFSFEAIFLRLQGALGLTERHVVVPAHQEVHVYPHLGDAGRFELLEHRLRLGMFGVRPVRLPGEGSDFDALRDYMPDDDVRWIDWNATARANHPVTRTYQVERNQTLYLLLDAGRLMASRVDGTLTKLDHSLNAAVALSYVALRQGDRVGVTAFADRLLASVAPKAGRSHLSTLLRSLFDIHPHFTDSNFEAAITHVRTQQRRRALVVLFTDFQDMTAARRFLAHVALLRPAHLPMVVALRDERLLETGRRVPETVADMYRVGVASELLLEREQILGELRRLGALVVEADAQHLALDAVQKYLEAKLRGRL